ncbi:MAG: helix-turn-helix domain-containing protein [Hyphomicrobiaceae bacterium]|nr:helix-turn-helix domain-containing protein [Hyphomicrobiaceae bacterium]
MLLHVISDAPAHSHNLQVAADPPPAIVAVAVVAQVFAVPAADLMRTTRGRAGVALARQIAMYLAHVVGGQTLTDIGHHFRRDRTTVAHACRLVESRRDDPSFDRVVELLEWIIPVFASRNAAAAAHQA